MKKTARWLILPLTACVFTLVYASTVRAAVPVIPRLEIGVGPAQGPQQVSQSLQLVALLTVLSLAPSILIMTTAFARIIVVLSFTRNALGLQQMPPNQVLIGLALFLTFFVMAPTWNKVQSQAITPYLAGKIGPEQAFDKGMAPIRDFMYRQTRPKDLRLFLQVGKVPRPKNLNDIPTQVLIPAFIISELKTAFQIGFMIFIPFLVIDMIVASTLMSMGMMMLPPVMISLPFKILLFVMVDGWYLVVRSLLLSFH
jgi:flagellar biosynthetic protein FliP